MAVPFIPESPLGRFDNPGLEDFVHNFQSQVTLDLATQRRILSDARNISIAVPNNDPDLQESIEMSIQEALFPLLTDGRASLIPKKTVVAFVGTLVEARRIRSGWGICDGTYQNGILKPDLRHKFLRGAGANADAGATGGADCSNVQVDPHDDHDLSVLTTDACDCPFCAEPCATGTEVTINPHTHGLNGTLEHTPHVETQSDNKPPFYEVIYLCRV
jgi:hypothetical protein